MAVACRPKQLRDQAIDELFATASKRPRIGPAAELFGLFWECVSPSGSPSTIRGPDPGAFRGGGGVHSQVLPPNRTTGAS